MRIDVKEILELNDTENKLLDQYRNSHFFSVKKYIDDKTYRLSQYCETYNIDSLTVLISGGVDSAVVAAICNRFTQEYGKKLHLVTIPETDNKGVVRQDDTVRLAHILADSLGSDLTILPLDKIVAEGARLCGLESDWGIGQTVSYFRTSLAYSYVTSLWANGERNLLVGTTNLDEGAYIGYIGKASDCMVDLQLISDIHKSEVYQVADYLDVPEDITHSIPRGTCIMVLLMNRFLVAPMMLSNFSILYELVWYLHRILNYGIRSSKTLRSYTPTINTNIWAAPQLFIWM